MIIYKVGGAIRDQLLNRKVKDLDFVVVGSTAEEMLSLGYKQVGADFPVFLDKKGHEFALARTERKNGSGYHGFDVDCDDQITIEQDLSRRDLTINAMAQRVTQYTHHDVKKFKYCDQILDPYDGQYDLKNATLRHVSIAFADDPVRVLRIARFAARYQFTIDESTLMLIHRMATDNQFESLTSERVWSELSKGLMEPRPDLFIETLIRTNLVKVILHMTGPINLLRLRHSATLNMPLDIRLISCGFTSDNIKQLSGTKHIINIIKQFELFCQNNGGFFNCPLTTNLIIQLYQQFNILHAKSYKCITLLNLLKLKAIIDNDLLAYKASNLFIIDKIRKIKHDETLDMAKNEIGTHLWSQRYALLDGFISNK